MVFLPGISKSKRHLEKRKGGGGGGRGGGGGSGSAGGSAGGGRSSSVSAGGSSRSASDTSPGGGKITTIPQGQLFSGRSQGGGQRSEVFGSRQYGSGYPGVASRGVAGLGFPFFFWPVVFGTGTLVGTGAYLHAQEYGGINNSSRPGGTITTAAFSSNSTNSTFRLLSDNTTVSSLLTSVVANCSSFISSPSSIAATTYNDSGPPGPGQAIQYYRASSVVLTLDGYNDTAVFTDDPNVPDSPLPSSADTNLLNCLNSTIGQSVPLVDGAYGLGWSSPPNLGLLVLVFVISKLVSQV